MESIRNIQVRELKDQFEKVSAAFRALVDRLGEDLVTRHPYPQSWSVADCIAHLTVTSEAFFPRWQEQIEAHSVEAKSAGKLRLGLLIRLIIRMMEPPVRFRISTPQSFVPVAVGPARRVFDDFLSSQTKVLKAIENLRDLPADRLKIVSPFSARLRYTLWGSFHIAAAHQRRHLWQAEQAAHRLKPAPDQHRRAAQP